MPHAHMVSFVACCVALSAHCGRLLSVHLLCGMGGEILYPSDIYDEAIAAWRAPAESMMPLSVAQTECIRSSHCRRCSLPFSNVSSPITWSMDACARAQGVMMSLPACSAREPRASHGF